jgi:tetratricopeptide (TPR) repeat protein
MAHNHNKIILLLMIKNESKIIERCIGRALEHCDAICILDTGSTDNTVEVCKKFLTESGKPFKVSVEPFKNFGYNRTVSFQKAQELCRELEWDANITYTMTVDADMIIKPSPTFKDYKMTNSGYTIMQQNGSLKYYNTRFMRCSYNWKCIGGTHEYWSGDPVGKIPYETIYIDDVNDGGCKSDKNERDVRLLKEDLKEDFNNGRAHFYLAQTYKDGGKPKEAIDHYKMRIKIGGWVEEVWYSHYQISKCYQALNDIEEMESWGNKAFKYRPQRAEPIYHLTKYFREHSDHYKAYHYYLKGRNIPFPKDDVLFIEHDIYNGLFDYENTILACYVCGKSRQDSLGDMITYINNKNYYYDNVWDNVQYYVEPLTNPVYKGAYTKLFFSPIDEYQVSSCSILPFNDKLIMNTRYVNYSIDNKGGYPVRSNDGIVKTKNAVTFLDKSYYPMEQPVLMTENLGNINPCSPQGLEDVRLFSFKNTIYFNANTKHYNNNGHIELVIGEYNIGTHTMQNINVIQSPKSQTCEKNWIYIPEYVFINNKQAKDKMNFIYNWHPLEIGSVSESKKLEIFNTFDTPRFFSRFRGSSNIFEYNGQLWCLAHIVKYSTPRIYYHVLIAFNRHTMKPELYSFPFCFRKVAIEYCLSIHIKDSKICFIFSQNDSEPGIITVPLDNLRFLPIN